MNGYHLKNDISNSDHIIGKIGYKIKIIEYGDYECQNTKKNQVIIENLISLYPDQICFAFRHFPRSISHKYSTLAAIASEAAHLQGCFWDMHRAMMKTHAQLNTENLFKIARHIGLDIKRFLLDFEDTSITNKIDLNIQDGIFSGVKVTPTIFINQHCLVGLLEMEQLKSLVEGKIQSSSLSF